MPQKTILISINASWNIINFRKGLIAALQGKGFRVVALAPRDAYSCRFDELGVEYVPIEMDKQGVSPLKDLRLLWSYFRLLRRIRPHIFLGYTAKPNIYGSLAAHALGIPVINNVAGLGTAFIREGLLTRIVTALYKLALRRSSTVFFQNAEDRALFLTLGIVRADQTALLPGSGIDLLRFAPGDHSSRGPEFQFLLIARLLWDKGIAEYVEAARRLKATRPDVRFQLLGFLDVENRTAIRRADVERWVSEGIIDYLGEADDVRPFIGAADCIVLPSYREGLPRVLLEGSALAKPLIATDVPGCRDVIEDGRNGYLCAVRDPEALAAAMLKMLTLTPDERRKMGDAARLKVEAEFDERIAIERYFSAIERALS